MSSAILGETLRNPCLLVAPRRCASCFTFFTAGSKPASSARTQHRHKFKITNQKRMSRKIATQYLNFMQPFRFLLYCLSSIAGIVGLFVGGAPMTSFISQRLSGTYSTEHYDEFFRCAVIFFLSLILLILVHLGHRLAGAFDISLPTKSEKSEPIEKSEVRP